MMVNLDVDGYTKTLNQRLLLHVVLLTLNQLNIVLKLELSPKFFFSFQFQWKYLPKSLFN